MGGAQDLGAQWPYALAMLLFAAGMWLLLPRGERGGRAVGAGLAFAGLALLTLLVHFGLTIHEAGARRIEFVGPLPALGGWTRDGVFLVLAAMTVGSAIGAVTFRSPVYCAIWFAMTLLGTAGLFMVQGAQFLAVATVVVYAGAILVTFLFVLMLAQPEGHAFYDRISWEGPLSACAGAVMVGLMTMTLSAAIEPAPAADAQEGNSAAAQPTVAKWLEPKLAADRSANVLASEHVAGLGARLFSTHLIAVEIAGTLLLIALVGAIAIVAHAENKEPSTAASSAAGGRHG
jgi:NADH-quinone oxidoreductase subunit J